MRKGKQKLEQMNNSKTKQNKTKLNKTKRNGKGLENRLGISLSKINKYLEVTSISSL